MAHRPTVARTLPALHRSLEELRSGGATVALVPTMGALHEGHLALVRLARRRADRIAVSIFVNPTQFAAHEDFGSYPRPLKTDIGKLAAEGVDLVWNPDARTMYPDGFATRINPEGAAQAGLEDRIRPHFFGGVATVVTKLFAQCRPDIAVFGQKDYQQLQVVTQLSRDLDLRVRVIGMPTVRERDGLAMSSRNAYLAPAERAAAPALYAALRLAKERLRDGGSISTVTKAAAAHIAKAGFTVDYFAARHSATLQPLTSVRGHPVRLLVAARIGKTRLIDNLAG